MGMRIGGSGNGWASQQSNAVGNWQQRQQNFKSLKSALQTGDLTAAQQAFAAISASNPNAINNNNSPLAQIGQALQAGNMSGAQTVAQNWQHGHEQSPGFQPSAGSTSAAQSFLQTLSTNLSSNTVNASNSPSAQAVPVTSTATSQEQVTQALMAFEKNLFDALQAQSSQSSATTSSATTAATSTDPNAVATSTTVTGNSGQNPVMHGHHHHHGGGQGGGQMSSELSSLIGQTPQTNDGTSTDANNPNAGLDQSFKSLLSTLGVSGNNASLNSFLQSMSATMQASSTSGA
jgi:hypothetical protein